MSRGHNRRDTAGRFGDKANANSGIAREAKTFGLTADQALRLASWSVELAEHLLAESTPSYALDSETRFGRRGALAVHHDGSWHDFEGDAHGHGALSLIAHLQTDSSPAIVRSIARTWLQQHPGHGAHAVTGSNDKTVSAREQARAEFARLVLSNSQPISDDNEVMRYLQNRGLLQTPPPSAALYYPNARPGEAALVGVLRKADGRAVGVQLGYIDPRGRKSVLQPQRAIFMAETNRNLRQDAAFRMAGQPLPSDAQASASKAKGNGSNTEPSTSSSAAPAEPSDVEEAAPTSADPPATEVFARKYAVVVLFTEGLENVIALHTAMPYSAIVGYPGIGHLRHQPVRAKQSVVVFKDGDAADAASTQTLIRGLDHLVIAGAEVLVTDTPAKTDVNSVKLDANSVLEMDGVAAIQALIAGAQPHQLSPGGYIRKLAALKQSGALLQYEQERIKVAEILKIRRLTKIDAMVNALLPPMDDGDGEEADVLLDLPWETTITDFGAVLDEALATVKRFVAASETYLAAGVVWAAHSHLVHSDTILLTVTPRALVTAVAENSGKSTLLKSMRYLSARSMMFVNLTPAALFRVVAEYSPTLFVDEAEGVFAQGRNPDLLSLVNTGFERGGVVPRVEEIHGVRQVVLFPVWSAMAMAAIGRLPVATTQSRCIVIELRRALAGSVPERLRPGMEEAFTPTRRKLVRWAQDLETLPEVPALPGLDNRVGDNWEPLRQVAALAGGRWPALIERAALTDATDGADVGSLVPLLTDIREVFGAQARLSTTEIIDGLLSLEEPSAEWDRVNRGREITAVWLARRLRGALPRDPDSVAARHWKEGGRTFRGYPVEQFDDAIQRYLGTTADSASSQDKADSAPTSAPEPETDTVCVAVPPRTTRHPAPSRVTLGKDAENHGAGSKFASGTARHPAPPDMGSAEVPGGPAVPGGAGSEFSPGTENSQCGTEEIQKVPGAGSVGGGDSDIQSGSHSELPQDGTVEAQPTENTHNVPKNSDGDPPAAERISELW